MPEKLPHVLFVCVENSCRSQMAEGFARTRGAERIATYSAGSRPSGQVNPRAIVFMRERGIDLTQQASKGLDDLPPGVRWDFLVTMGCGDACPHLPAKTRLDWELPDPKAMADDDFRRVRDRIDSLVGSVLELAAPARKRLNVFERYLSLWVAICMLVGVALGKLVPGFVAAIRGLEFGEGSRINLAIAVLIWLMIYPMMLKIDFGSLLGVRRKPGGLLVTLFVTCCSRRSWGSSSRARAISMSRSPFSCTASSPSS